eukprot:c14862_g1_i1.p1 GENE.c14862_g1_i1~~c14862_g1_i1.p1  ORF type:complete len:267 (+),score=93.52 c14862_g1_i1:27-827(+)
MSIELSEQQNALMGLLGGLAEVTATQGLTYTKNVAQQGLTFSFNPRILYRGYPSNAVNVGVLTMWQFAVCGTLKNVITGGVVRKLSLTEEVIAGFGAGASSALICTPLELIMIQQQRKGGSIPERVKHLNLTQLFRGFTMSSVREGCWATGIISLPPIIRDFLTKNHSNIFQTEDQARVAASFLSAFFSGIISHPADTIKTCMQGDIERVKYGSLTQSFATRYRELGFMSFFKGLPWRFARQVAAIFIIDKIRVDLSPIFFPEKFQ